ncbi:3-oxo-5a-steroid 4- dehydrogenase [Onygenales sp. PD_40]|nr:3-oxo-5a-steroid 4- dehydrogenase [Onygenales sp. PD_40]KAK2789790.1 3-oxo-5a-steroid 4- dehydrogenase [Onygenales sp. PD_12]
MSTTITLSIKPRGKPIPRLPREISIDPNASGADLYRLIAEKSKFSIHRVRVTKGSDGTAISNNKDVTIHSTGLRDQSTIYVKDLGAQLAWRTVYMIEYLGPIIIHPLLLLSPTLRSLTYRTTTIPSPSNHQLLLCALITLHFVKRELETIFIHRFGRATMPFTYVFRNSAHYWLLAGLNIAYWAYTPAASQTDLDTNFPPFLLHPGMILYTFGELANFSAHLTLRNLRRPGTTERGIPHGFGFGLVTCPNYLFEVLAWLGMYLVSGLSWSMLLFIVVACAPMARWARQKENKYRKEFGDKYKRKRYVMIPGLV